jgi:hypothetical protein
MPFQKNPIHPNVHAIPKDTLAHNHHIFQQKLYITASHQIPKRCNDEAQTTSKFSSHIIIFHIKFQVQKMCFNAKRNGIKIKNL